MVEASEIGLKEDEVELDLGLSIGGSFRKSEKLKPVFLFHSRSNGFDADLRENQTSLSRSCTSPSSLEPADRSAPLDPQTKREIQALRRQEAKQKQLEKRCRVRNSVRDNAREIQVEEQRACKREKTDCVGTESNNAVKNVNLNSSNGQTEHYSAPQVQYGQYPPVQFVPYTTNGFAFPCVVPCWAPGGNEKNVFQPVACRGFRPSLGHQNLGLNLTNGCDSEQEGRKDCETKLTASNGSPMCSSSTISDHRSSSHEGGGSSDTRTHSSHSLPGQHHVNGSKANDIKGHSEQSACSRPNTNESAQVHEDGYNDQKVVPAPVTQSSPAAGREEEAIQQATDPVLHEKPISIPCPLKETNTDIGKPPKPQLQSQNSLPLLQQMPYVSTTGNGPNGKTINGFLYRYTKSEVSIVCVCHGSTFSPDEFVQHAGGTDVSHPLRHITVIPSAFG